MMYKVVVLTWYEPEYIDYDRQPWVVSDCMKW